MVALEVYRNMLWDSAAGGSGDVKLLTTHFFCIILCCTHCCVSRLRMCCMARETSLLTVPTGLFSLSAIC
jgi:hypothetical protein